VKRSKYLVLLKIDTQDYFCLLEVFVLLNPFMVFVKLACELVQQVSATCSTAKYIYNEILCEHIIKIYLSYIFGGGRDIYREVQMQHSYAKET
jgi:hypothetical protein